MQDRPKASLVGIFLCGALNVTLSVAADETSTSDAKSRCEALVQ